MARSPKIIVQKANLFQLNPNNGYIIHVPGIQKEESDALYGWLKDQGVEKVVIVASEQIDISEVPQDATKQ
jgi:hypothetical protein